MNIEIIQADLAVLPEHRGRGLGTAMLAAIEDYARDVGCCKITLEVREDNAGARRLYQDVGFGTEILPTIFLEKSLSLQTSPRCRTRCLI